MEHKSGTTEVVVIGSGPGGYVAAIRAAQLGKKVVIVEKDKIGGVCLHNGCIPSKALISVAHKYDESTHLQDIGIEVDGVSIDFTKTQTWKQSVVNKLSDGVSKLLKKNNIEIVFGLAKFLNNQEVIVTNEETTRSIIFESCIIATGSRPIEIPSIPFSKRILSSSEALHLEEIPKSMVVIGGGYIGIELSQAFAKLGTKITIIEGAGSILPGFEARLVSLIKRNLKKAQVDVFTNATANEVHVHDDSVNVRLNAQGKENSVTAEYVLVTVGRRPNTENLGLENTSIQLDEKGYIQVNHQGLTAASNVYAIGDVAPGVALAHKASHDAKIAAEAIAGYKGALNYRTIPAVVFSDPEIATVGITEKEAKEQGYVTMIGRFSYAANGRALAMGASDGSVTIVADQKTHVVIGAQIIGSEASNLIAELAVSIEKQMKLEDIADTIHAHPTLSEMVMEAAEDALGKGIHTM